MHLANAAAVALDSVPIPKSLRCPITHEAMIDLVLTADVQVWNQMPQNWCTFKHAPSCIFRHTVVGYEHAMSGVLFFGRHTGQSYEDGGSGKASASPNAR